MKVNVQVDQVELDENSDIVDEQSFQFDWQFESNIIKKFLLPADGNWRVIDTTRIPNLTGMCITTDSTINLKINGGATYTVSSLFVLSGTFDLIEIMNQEDPATCEVSVYGE